MKIGILTFHRANNLGAVLQASALQKYIQDNFGKCEIIDYYPNNNIPLKYVGIKKFFRAWKRILTYPIVRKKNKRECRFNEYRNKYYVMTDRHYYGDNGINEGLEGFDIMISGSDQILNTTLTGCSKAYYLNFFEGKKISYASSFGREDITEDEIQLIKNELFKFTALSVREKSAGDIIKNNIGINPELVLDPVFLLKKKEWENRCNQNMKLPKRFIFVYSMEVSESLEKMVDIIKKEKNISVIVVRGGGKAGRIAGNEDLTCGPAEFLRYIKDAELVITNSFHGVALSIIMHKHFCAIAHSTKNTRIENILDLIGESSKMIYKKIDKPVEDYIIDARLVKNKVENAIKKSKIFLKMAIEKKGEDD